MHELDVPDGRLNTLFQPNDLIVDVLVASTIMAPYYLHTIHTYMHTSQRNLIILNRIQIVFNMYGLISWWNKLSLKHERFHTFTQENIKIWKLTRCCCVGGNINSPYNLHNREIFSESCSILIAQMKICVFIWAQMNTVSSFVL